VRLQTAGDLLVRLRRAKQAFDRVLAGGSFDEAFGTGVTSRAEALSICYDPRPTSPSLSLSSSSTRSIGNGSALGLILIPMDVTVVLAHSTLNPRWIETQGSLHPYPIRVRSRQAGVPSSSLIDPNPANDKHDDAELQLRPDTGRRVAQTNAVGSMPWSHGNDRSQCQRCYFPLSNRPLCSGRYCSNVGWVFPVSFGYCNVSS
jgi:hypothetical protein